MLAYSRAALSARIKAGCPNRAALAIHLHTHQGVNYDIRTPEKPLTEVLSAKEIQLIEALVLPLEAREESLGISAVQETRMIRHMKRVTGARTREELALMMKIYDTGERPDDTDGKRELSRKLGLPSLRGCDIDRRLELVDPRERKIIEARYLQEKLETWAEIGTRFGLHESTVFRISKKGTTKIRLGLEDGDLEITNDEDSTETEAA